MKTKQRIKEMTVVLVGSFFIYHFVSILVGLALIKHL